jgi:hypothetical protein
MRVDVGREAGVEPTVRQGPGAPGASSPRRRRAESAGGQGPGSRVQDGRGGALKRRGKAQESIGPKPATAGEWVRILAGSKTLEPRGTVTYWSSEQ